MQQEHVDILRRGVKHWNEWRESNPATTPDLRDADLREQALGGSYLIAADLSGADLRGTVLLGANLLGADLHAADLRAADLGFATLHAANLNVADLRGAILAEADLHAADLTEADLSEADLNDVNLRGADMRQAKLAAASLRGADLSYADLRKADLSAALLWRANLSHANFGNAAMRGAIFGETILARTRLADAEGLDSCVHLLPSAIDHQTIAVSGALPRDFMRSCGVPAGLMDYFESFLKDPLQSKSFVITYAGEDRDFVKKLQEDLHTRGVRCANANRDVKIGPGIGVGVDELVRLYDKVLLVLSKASAASDWAHDEVEAAIGKETSTHARVLYLLRTDGMTAAAEWLAKVKKSHSTGDFSDWKDEKRYAKALDQLLRDIVK
jgi:uncharacterized protein YjbI with pentapeptide repeats